MDLELPFIGLEVENVIMNRCLAFLVIIFAILLISCDTTEESSTTTDTPSVQQATNQAVPKPTDTPEPTSTEFPTDTPTPEPTDTPAPTATPDPLTTVAGANESLISAGLPGSAERIEMDSEGNALAYDADGNVIARVVSSHLAEGDTRAVWLPQLVLSVAPGAMEVRIGEKAFDETGVIVAKLENGVWVEASPEIGWWLRGFEVKDGTLLEFHSLEDDFLGRPKNFDMIRIAVEIGDNAVEEMVVDQIPVPGSPNFYVERTRIPTSRGFVTIGADLVKTEDDGTLTVQPVYHGGEFGTIPGEGDGEHFTVPGSWANSARRAGFVDGGVVLASEDPRRAEVSAATIFSTSLAGDMDEATLNSRIDAARKRYKKVLEQAQGKLVILTLRNDLGSGVPYPGSLGNRDDYYLAVVENSINVGNILPGPPDGCVNLPPGQEMPCDASIDLGYVTSIWAPGLDISP